MMLSPHFSLDEMVASKAALEHRIDNTAPQEIVPHLVALAQMLEEIRDELGVPLDITSGYRCPELNVAVGGVANSDHIYGRAADFEAPAFGSAHAIAQRLAPKVVELGIGQLILEGVKGKRWVHVSTRTPDKIANRVLTITDAGPQAGIHEVA
jgi:zinc D-Ala-D-Ala carboxypeptidase